MQHDDELMRRRNSVNCCDIVLCFYGSHDSWNISWNTAVPLRKLYYLIKHLFLVAYVNFWKWMRWDSHSNKVESCITSRLVQRVVASVSCDKKAPFSLTFNWMTYLFHVFSIAIKRDDRKVLGMICQTEQEAKRAFRCQELCKSKSC